MKLQPSPQIKQVMKASFAVVLLLSSTFLLFGQELPDTVPAQDSYGLGDQTFSISAGVNLPLFIHMLSGTVEPALPHVGAGAIGSLRWGTFLTNSVTFGAELGGTFAFTALHRTLVIVPVSAVFTYVLRAYPFEFPLHATLGVSFMRLDNDLYIGPIVKPGASAYWSYNSEWSFGLQLEYLWVPEIYFGPLADQSAFGNFLSVTLSTLYHF